MSITGSPAVGGDADVGAGMHTALCRHCIPTRIIVHNDLAYARREDVNPASCGHVLVIPFRHVLTFFDASMEEQQALIYLLNEIKKWLDREFAPPRGYKVRFNKLKRTEPPPHMHIDVIPRYR
jgi:diadenosine tetraphosphate (Ap4A) HIT family hydrolase